jgi:hypothetical protein
MLFAAATVAVGAALVLPGAAGAQTAGQDSVTLTGTASAFTFVVSTLNATSGPSGENPSGQVNFLVLGSLNVGGPVTCLAVNGNSATLNIQDPSGIVTIQVVDNQPDTFDAFPTGRTPTDCSPLPPSGLGGPLSSGDITVFDAPPLPTSKDQCTNGGWRNFPGFKNQGDCVSFVATGRKNPPGAQTG